MDVVTKDQAIDRGLTKFFTGIPCVRGHISERYVTRSRCLACKAEDERAWYAKKHDSVLNYRQNLRSKPEQRARARQKAKEYREKNRQKVADYQAQWYIANPQYAPEYRAQNPIKTLLASVRARAKRGNLEFSLREEDIMIPTVCPILGISLDRNSHDHAPSIDRIDNTRGYTKDNICVISVRANRLKSDASVEEIEAVLRYIKTQLQSTHP